MLDSVNRKRLKIIINKKDNLKSKLANRGKGKRKRQGPVGHAIMHDKDVRERDK